MQMNIVIWGYCYSGTILFNKLRGDSKYNVIGFADNSKEKQRFFVNGHKIISLDECKTMHKELDYSVIIANSKWFEVGLQLEEFGIPIFGIFIDGEIRKYKQAHFSDLYGKSEVKLYAGDICDEVNLRDPNLYGLSISQGDEKHIYHDITKKYPLPDNFVSSYVAEHVFEHIEYSMLTQTINEIYRVLKIGAKLRICLPDYNSPWLKQLSMCDKYGNIFFDANGGGVFQYEKATGGGHLWFPTYTTVKNCIDKTMFNNVEFIRFRNRDESIFERSFDNSREYLHRMETNHGSNDANIIIDCIK